MGNRILIAVGDVTGKKLVDKRIEPDIWIYDRKEMRKKVKWKTPFPTHLVKNPRGTITRNLIAAIKDAISIGKRSKSKIFVKGEEDLSVLPAIEIAPIGTIIVYGQPKKGVVFIEVNKQAKSFAKKILSSILSQPSL